MRRLYIAACLLGALAVHAQTPNAAADKPLPPVDQLLKSVEKNERHDEALLAQYTYHVHEVEEDFDGSDAVKKSKITDSESIPVEGVRIDRVVARDGKPLSPDDAAKEDAAFNKRVEAAKKEKARQESGKDEITASQMLALGDFTNERRVDLNGRPTIVVDYAGKHDVKSATALQKMFECLGGTVWIDEEDKVVAKIAGQFNADFKLGFGLLADIHKGLTFTFEQTKINDEVWLPVGFRGEGKASLGWLILRVHGRESAQMTDYRKYRASAKLLPGEQVVDDKGNPVPEPAPAKTPAP